MHFVLAHVLPPLHLLSASSGLLPHPDPAGTNPFCSIPVERKGKQGPLIRTRGGKGVSSFATPPQKEVAEEDKKLGKSSGEQKRSGRHFETSGRTAGGHTFGEPLPIVTQDDVGRQKGFP